MPMTRDQAAELKVEDALQKIEAARNLLGAACADLSPIIGAVPHWKRVGKLYDRVHDSWRKLAYSSRDRWKLDHEPKE